MLSSGVFPSAPKAGEKHVVLLIIDPQKDFHDSSPKPGTLPVPGSTADSKRIAKMILRESGNIDQIFVTMDSHNRNHIAHASFWFSEKATNDLKPEEKRDPKPALKAYSSSVELYQPTPFTIIRKEDIGKANAGKWEPVDQSLLDYCREYAETLKNTSNHFDLCIWPEHCIVGTPGHCVQEDVFLATQQWQRDWQKTSFVTGNADSIRTVNYVYKGNNNLTEMYSAIRAEVPVAADPSTDTNRPLLEYLRQASKVVVCGQAQSHCVNFTVRDIVEDWKAHRLSLRNIVLLTDAMSNVTTFETQGQKFLDDMRANHLTLTTTLDTRIWR